MKNHARFLAVALAACLPLSACGDDALAGKSFDCGMLGTLDFLSGGKATITRMGSTVEMTYEMRDANSVAITNAGTTEIIKIVDGNLKISIQTCTPN